MKQVLTFVLLFFTVSAYGQIPNTLSPAEKVYGLSKFWQEVNYNFVYLNKANKEKWDSSYLSLIPQVQKTENDYEYFRLLKQFCATLKDGHTNIDFPNEIQSKLMRTDFGEYRFFIENIEHRAIITHVNTSKKNIIPPGSEILSVNGLPTNEYITQFVSPFISSSTRHGLADEATIMMLQGFEGEQYKLKIKKPKGEIIELVVKHSKCAETEVFPIINNSNSLINLSG